MFVVVAVRRGGATVAGSADCLLWWRYGSRVGRLFVLVAAQHGGATVAGSAGCLLWWLRGVVALW